MLRGTSPASMFAVLAAYCSAAAIAQVPLGPGFTYSGQLNSAGNPANGPHNFSFRLYNAAAGGTLLGTDTINGVQVVDGVFTVILNENDEFGATAFNGSRRWLEVVVNGTPLAPRQELTATPYALFAAAPWDLNGTSLSYTGGNVGVGTTAPAAPLTVQASGNGFMHTDGTHSLVTFTGGGAGWLGTFTSHPLNFFTGNGPARMTVNTAGNVGIGTTTPAQRLSVAGTVQSTSGGFMFPDGTVQSSAATGGGGFWSPSGSNIFNNNSGNVGIGRNAPAYKLDTDTTSGLGARIGMQSAGGGALVVACNPGDNSVYLEGFNSTNDGSASQMLLTGFSGGWMPQLTLRALTTVVEGTMAIGTTSSNYPLTIRTSDSPFVLGYGWVHTNGTVDLGSYLTTDGGWLGTRTNHPLYFFTNDSSPRMTLSTTGKLGIGTLNPICPLHAVSTDPGVSATYGITTAGTQTAGVYAESTASNGNGLIGQANNGSNAYGVWGRATNGIGGYFSGGNYAIYAAGRVRVGVLEIAGADVAEKFPTSEPAAGTAEGIEPGTVMEIDPGNAGHLRIARQAYSSRVAGVVSGAGDLPVGAILGHIEESKDGPAIALSGRVWVKCDAAHGAIRPGDLLTTSDTAGHAMKSLDRDRAHGAVLGKAMTSLESGCGLVLVLVNLQ